MSKFEIELKRALSILKFSNESEPPFSGKKIQTRSNTQNQNKSTSHLDNLNKRIENILILPDNMCQVECISKLSPFVSNRIEHTLIDYLNETCPDNAIKWMRFESKFPDLQIVCNDKPTGFGIEIKVVCAMCEEPSARFWHATENFSDYDCQFITILAWNLSNKISGYPQLVNSFSIDAKKLAEDRDIGIHNPPHRLVSHPKKMKSKNTKQTDIKVLIFQGNEIELEEAQCIVSNHQTSKPWEEPQKKLTEILLSKFHYREDSNTGKLNRIQNSNLNKFIKSLK